MRSLVPDWGVGSASWCGCSKITLYCVSQPLTVYRFPCVAAEILTRPLIRRPPKALSPVPGESVTAAADLPCSSWWLLNK